MNQPQTETHQAKAQAQAHPLSELLSLVRQMSNRLEAIASQTPPDWQLPLHVYKADWVERIGAMKIARDQHGPTQVIWCGHTYTRRTGSNTQYGAAIWFSRKLDAETYGRLITFQDLAPAQALPDYVIKALNQ